MKNKELIEKIISRQGISECAEFSGEEVNSILREALSAVIVEITPSKTKIEQLKDEFKDQASKDLT